MNAAVGGPGGPRRGANALAPAAVLGELTSLMSRRIQHALDATVPHTGARWGATAGLALLYALRVWALGGFYIVTYGLGIYLLNLFIGFITPQVRARVGECARARAPRRARRHRGRSFFPARRSTRRPRARCCRAAAPRSTGRTSAGCPSLSFGAGARAAAVVAARGGAAAAAVRARARWPLGDRRRSPSRPAGTPASRRYAPPWC